MTSSFLAAAVGQAAETAVSMPVPLLFLIGAIASALLGLAGWVLNIERKKVEKKDYDRDRDLDRQNFEKYSSRVESRMTALHAEMMAAVIGLKTSLRHVDECPYLKDIGRKAEGG